MAILNFPNTRDNGDPLEIGDTYTGGNGVVYTYDGAKWSGRNISTIPTSNAIVNAGYVVQVDTGGNLFTPSYIFPNLPGQEGQVLTWPASGTILEWTDQSGTGGGVSISDFGEGFSLTAANKIVTNKLYSTNQTQSSQHYRLELDTNGVIVLPDQSIINGSTLRGVYGTGDMNYTGITIGPDADHREESWVWVDHTGVSIATEYSTSAYTWKFDNDGVLTLPGGNTQISNQGMSSTSSSVVLASVGATGGAALEWISDPELSTSTKIAFVIANNPLSANSGTVQIATGGIIFNGPGQPPTLENVWDFGKNGTLTIPDDIQDANGSVVRVATTSTAPTRVNGQLWFNTIDGRAYIRYDNTWLDLSPTEVPPPSTYLDGLTIDGTTISAIDSTATVSIESGSNMWDFSSTGTLTLPGGGVFDDINYSGAVLQAPTGKTIEITSHGFTSGFQASDTNALIYTDAGNWTFGADGSLTFPNNTVQTTAWPGGNNSSVSTAANSSNNFNIGSFINNAS